MVDIMGINGGLLDCPGDGGSHGFSEYGSTSFADGRQLSESPFFRTVLPELIHEESVRQHDQVHVPGLALAVAQLTISHAQLLLSVPMKGLRTCPAMSINQENPHHLPADTVGHQDFARLFVSLFVPNDNDTHFVVDVGDVQGHGEVPLLLASTPERPAIFRRDLGSNFVDAHHAAFPLDLAVEFQVSHIAPRPVETIPLGMNMVEDLGIGEVAVEGEIAGNFPLADPIDQLATEFGVVEEFFAGHFALFPLAETAEFQRVMLPAAANVVGEQIVVGDLVSPLGVVPEPAYVLDEFSVVVDQNIVDGDNPTVGVACAGVLLQQLQPTFVQFVGVPIHFGQELVETGLICGLGELPVDPQHRFSLGNHQPGEIFAEMLSLWLVGKHVCVLFHGFLHHLRKFDDPWHTHTIPGFRAPP